MHYVALVTVFALVEFLWLGMRVAGARVKYGVMAPATTGNERFERHFRIHVNTLEQLILFVPAMWMCARYFDPAWTAAVGMLFVIGRLVYARAYLRSPDSRTTGFVLSILPVGLFLAGTVWGAVRALLLQS